MRAKLIITGLTIACCALILAMVVRSRGAEEANRRDRLKSASQSSALSNADFSGTVVVGGDPDLDHFVEDLMETDHALSSRIDRFKCDDMKLADAIDLLRQKTDVNIIVAWKELEASGVTRDAKVSLDLKDARVSAIMECIAREAGGGSVKLGYEARPGYILLGTNDGIVSDTITELYDVSDLLWSMISRRRRLGEDRNSGYDREVEGLERLIQESVDPISWRDEGGTVGSLREIDGMLMVTQTVANQHRLAEVLSKLRQLFKSGSLKANATTEPAIESMIGPATTAPLLLSPATTP